MLVASCQGFGFGSCSRDELHEEGGILKIEDTIF